MQGIFYIEDILPDLEKLVRFDSDYRYEHNNYKGNVQVEPYFIDLLRLKCDVDKFKDMGAKQVSLSQEEVSLLELTEDSLKDITVLQSHGHKNILLSDVK